MKNLSALSVRPSAPSVAARRGDRGVASSVAVAAAAAAAATALNAERRAASDDRCVSSDAVLDDARMVFDSYFDISGAISALSHKCPQSTGPLGFWRKPSSSFTIWVNQLRFREESKVTL